MKHYSFLDFFPPPKFLEMRPVGLALSERAVHVVEFIRQSHGLVLGKFGKRSIPEGAIKEGYVNDKRAVTEVLQSLQKELGLEFVNVSLPEEKAYLFKIDIPNVSEENIRDLIELHLEENVPLKASDAIFDYTIIPENSGKDHLDVSVSVLPSKVAETYLEIIKAAGLKAVSFETEAEALSRSVISKGDLGTSMIVNVGDTRTGLSVISGGVVQFSLTVQIGAEVITAAVAKHYSVDAKEAQEIKDTRGFSKNSENMEFFFSLTNTVSSIKDEINKLQIYWQTHSSHKAVAASKIGKIVLCGRDAGLIGFREYLSMALKIKVDIAPVWQNVFSYEDHIPTISFLDSLDYASAIGLALPS